MKKQKQCKWNDAFFRAGIIAKSGEKFHGETWRQYAKRKNIKVPKNFVDRF